MLILWSLCRQPPSIMKRSIQLAPLKFLKYLIELNGLLPFYIRFNGQQVQANESVKCMCYSVAIFVIFLLAIIWSNYLILLVAIAHPEVKYIFNFGSYLMSSLQTLTYSMLQLTRSHRLIDIINTTQRLHVRIEEVFRKKTVDFYKPLRRSEQLLIWKVLSVFVQLMLIAFLCVSLPLSCRRKFVPVGVIATHFYIPLISVLVSCLFFVGLLVMWQFYAKLNSLARRAIGDVRSMVETANLGSFSKMNICCTLSDELDWLAKLYTDVDRCTKTIVDFFACQIVVQFAYAIICITIEVEYS